MHTFLLKTQSTKSWKSHQDNKLIHFLTKIEIDKSHCGWLKKDVCGDIRIENKESF